MTPVIMDRRDPKGRRVPRETGGHMVTQVPTVLLEKQEREETREIQAPLDQP